MQFYFFNTYGGSNLVLINRLHFSRLDAQVFQCLLLGTVIKAYHQRWQISSKCDPLVISPGFPETV
jgi:hypothetical protein